MTELNVKIEIRKTAIQRKIKKNPVYQNSHKSKVSMAQRTTRGLFVQGI